MKPEPTSVTVSLTGGKTLTFETGKLAKQAHGSAVVRLGENVVLATAVANPEPREGIDFFPLTVDYREYTYAGGRFPGGFIKREGRMSEREVLTSRHIDRPIRPMFAEGFKCETQVIAFVLSADADISLPYMLRRYRGAGIDPLRERILTYPVLHYQNGGLVIDTDGETTLEGGFACGEIAGGTHGRNRMLGNSLLECVVFGRRAGRAAAAGH